MRTIISSSGTDCVLIILFQLYCSKAGLSEANYEAKASMTPQPSFWEKN